MKKISSILFWLAASLAFISCSGNIDPSEMTLSLRADKSTIYADGSDAVTFTATYAGEDVSKSKNLYLVIEGYGSNKNLEAGVNTFSTTTAGEYSILAKYTDGDKIISSAEKIIITAKEPEVTISSGYFHKMLAMEFTSIWCTYCPILADAMEQVQRTYPGRTIPVAFHDNSMGDDPMTLPLNNKFYEKVTTGEGLPLFALDFRKSSQHIINEYAKIVSEIELQMGKYKPDCGVAIESSYNASTGVLDVKAKFKSDVAAAYRYHIFLVESGIEGTQAGHEGSAAFVHDNVVRAIASDNVYGNKLNEGKELSVAKEYEVSKSFNIPAEWKTANMKVVVSILKSKDGSSYECDNSNDCALGESVGYLYEKDYEPSLEFGRRVCVMEFTGSWCAQCPQGATTLNYLVSKAYKDKAYALAFHNEDDYSIPQEQELYKIFKWGGYPAYVTDMRDCGMLNEGGCSSSIEKSLYDEATYCSAAVACTYNQNDGTVKVKASVLSGKEAEYRLAAYIIEDKIIGKQILGTGEEQKDYTHRHVVRKMLSSSVKGDNLGTIAFGQEAEKTYSFSIDGSWNKDNVSVAVLAIDASGKVNNMAICAAVNGKMDYAYNE